MKRATHVQGSDVEEYFTQRDLEKAGITLLPFDKENIQPEMVIIQGNAFPDTHEEILRAKELRVRNYALP